MLTRSSRWRQALSRISLALRVTRCPVFALAELLSESFFVIQIFVSIAEVTGKPPSGMAMEKPVVTNEEVFTSLGTAFYDVVPNDFRTCCSLTPAISHKTLAVFLGRQGDFL
jgi:hypothetical protein